MLRSGVSRCLFLLASVMSSMLTAPPASAQFGQPRSHAQVRGQVEADADLLAAHLSIELMELGGSGLPQRAALHVDGTFDFRRVPMGSYNLQVTGPQGNVIHQTFITVGSITESIVVRIPAMKKERPVSGLVSVKQLQVPKKALKFFSEAQKYSEAGRTHDAIAALEKALGVYPEFGDAYANLGSQYVKLNRPHDALNQFEKAIKYGPESATLLTNYAVALVIEKRMDEARKAAERAVLLDNTYLRAHYILGCALSDRPDTSMQAIEHLRKSIPVVPSARARVAMLLAQNDHLAEAADELRTYLKEEKVAERRAQAEQMLARVEAAAELARRTARSPGS